MCTNLTKFSCASKYTSRVGPQRETCQIRRGQTDAGAHCVGRPLRQRFSHGVRQSYIGLIICFRIEVYQLSVSFRFHEQPARRVSGAAFSSAISAPVAPKSLLHCILNRLELHLGGDAVARVQYLRSKLADNHIHVCFDVHRELSVDGFS